MALGTLGSTLNDELNRLANGGTYRDMNQMVDEALAAKQWANRENINPYSTDTVGILNEIAGLGLDKKNWLDFNGVCNYIAGTTGLPAAAALRQVYPTTDLLTGVASYYVDATAPTNWGSLGYVRLNGFALNYLTVPDANNLDITGDIDVRIRVGMDNWAPTADQCLISKRATGQWSWQLVAVNTSGFLSFGWTTDGSTSITATSNAATGFAAGAVKWVRATLSVASNYKVRFFTSDDGNTWTQLGTDINGVGSTSIFSGTSQIEIGANRSGNNLVTGNFYQAQVLNGIGGTTVLDVNIATDYRSSNQSFFTATTGQTVTVNGVDTIANLGNAGSLLPTTLGSSTAADSNDPKFLDFTGTNYVYLPGVNSNFMYVPDTNDLDITGDIDIRAQVALDSWTGANRYLVAKIGNATNQFSYGFRVNTTGGLDFLWSPDGTNASLVLKASTVATGLNAGATKWVRVTVDVDNGASGYDVKFWTSDDNVTYTQLGTTVTTAGTISFYQSTARVTIGSSLDDGTLLPNTGKFYRAQIFNGIDGTKVLDVDTSTLTRGDDAYIVPTTYSGAAGAYFTGTGLSLNGVAGNYVSTPDASQLDITGDIDIAVQVALADWTPAAENALIGKWQAGTQFSYVFSVQTDGTLLLRISSDGSTWTSNISSVATGIADGATSWVRATRRSSNGNVTFYKSDDGTNWTQIGTVVGTTSGNIFSGTSILEVGSRLAGTSLLSTGTFYRAVIKSGIDGFPVFDATFVGVPANSLRMIESSTYKAVVTLNTTRYCTINRSTSGRKTVAVTQPTWLFGTDDYMEVNNRYMSSGTYLYLPGIASNYASAPDAAPLDVTGDIDIRVKVALDDWTPSTDNVLVSKETTSRAYQLVVTTTGLLALYWSADGTNRLSAASSVATGLTDGSTKWVRATLDVDNGAGGNSVQFFLSDDGTNWTQLGTTVTAAGTTSIFNNTVPLQVGASNNGGSNPGRGKYFRAQVLNGINGTVAFDANFETSITSLNQTSFTESSANAATVTINRSGSTYRSAGITTAGYLYPGATNTFAASATDFLNFGASDNLTVMIVGRQWNTPVSTGSYINKSTLANNGYWLSSLGTALTLQGQINDGTTTASSTSQAISAGSGSLLGIVVNRSTQTISTFVNSTLSATASTSSVGNISNIFPLAIGKNAAASNFYQDFEFVGAAIFRTALSTTQIRQISNYFANREVYL